MNTESKTFDFDKLNYVTQVVTNNLNRVIDINFYPTEKTKTSNLKHRPIGIGVQGLADTFILLYIPFHSDDAKNLNKQILNDESFSFKYRFSLFSWPIIQNSHLLINNNKYSV